MSQNNLPASSLILSAGLDVHKDSLQLHLAGRDHVLANDSSGHRRLVALLRTAQATPVQVICEASGGYERAVADALWAAGVPVSVLNPARVRAFAGALGQRAKTDPLDAALLARCGQALRPDPTPAPDPAQAALQELVRYRAQLVAQLATARQQQATLGLPALVRQSRALLKRLTADVAKVDALLAKHLAAQAELAAKAARLQAVPGVGAQTAYSLLAELPRAGHAQPRPGGGARGRGPAPAPERPVARPEPHRRRACPGAQSPLHGRLERRALAPALARLLCAAARGGQARQGSLDGRHAQARLPAQPGAENSQLFPCKLTPLLRSG